MPLRAYRSSAVPIDLKPSICIAGLQIPKGYSGGRYHAVMAAVALAEVGWDVTMWSDCVPEFFDNDFVGYPSSKHIRWHLDKTSFCSPPKGRFDWLLVVPDRSAGRRRYANYIAFGACRKIPIALLNFESPNWFNSLAPHALDERLWSGWRAVSKVSSVVISSARESSRFARQYYQDSPRGCVFADAHPSINSAVALSQLRTSHHSRQRQIVVITRLQDAAHKGAQDLLALMVPDFSSYTFVIIADPRKSSQRFVDELHTRAAINGIHVVFQTGIEDREKFRILATSRALVFLSRFEGFGYPPVEAAFMGLPVLCYDLPVIRETCADLATYAAPGDTNALSEKLATLLDPYSRPLLVEPPEFRSRYCIEAFGERLDEIFNTTVAANVSKMRFLRAAVGAVSAGFAARR